MFAFMLLAIFVTAWVQFPFHPLERLLSRAEPLNSRVLIARKVEFLATGSVVETCIFCTHQEYSGEQSWTLEESWRYPFRHNAQWERGISVDDGIWRVHFERY